MNAFRLLDDMAPHPVAAWAPVAAGLAAASCVAWLVRPVPRVLSWNDVFVWAAVSVSAVFLASLAVAWVLYVFLPPRVAVDIRYTTLRTSATAVWLPPLVLFLSDGSLWALAAGVIFFASLTRLLRQHAHVLDGGDAQDGFALPRQFAYAVCASVCLEAGVLAIVADRPMAAASLVGISAAALTLRLNVASARRSLWRAPLALLAAMIFMAGGLTTRLPVEYRSGTGDSGSRKFGFIHAAQALLLGLFPGEQPSQAEAGPKRAKRAQKSRAESAVFVVGGSFPGVILWPEEQRTAILVPPLPALGPKLFAAARAQPLSIPFYGAYWFFQAPDRRPPDGSFTARGSPAAKSFRSVDRRPLFMEAHQNFGTIIDLKCCREIRIAIRKADNQPGAIALELVLVNAALPGRPTQSLGWAAIPDRGLSSLPNEEELTFVIPAASAIREFDEVTIRFRLEARRADRSARIAIERFVFVPAWIK